MMEQNFNSHWTPVEKSELVRLHSAGRSAREIAELIGKSKKAVHHKIALLKDGPREPSKPPLPKGEWTPEEKDKLLKLAAQGLSFGRIADEIGRSRNSVIGYAHRIGLVGHKGSDRKVDPRTNMKPVAKKPARTDMRPMNFSHGKALRSTPIAPTPIEPAPVLVECEHKTLMKMKAGECKWPVGVNNKGDHLFCCAPRSLLKSYCDHHFSISYVPQKGRTKPIRAEAI